MSKMARVMRHFIQQTLHVRVYIILMKRYTYVY
jgi:hypothetical protein